MSVIHFSTSPIVLQLQGAIESVNSKLMNKNYLIIGLIILALVVIGFIASRPGEEVVIDDQSGDTTATTNDPSIQVSAQTLSGEQIMIDRVVAGVDGWVVLHRADADGSPDTSSNLGYARVIAGNNSGVVITLEEEVESGDVLVAMLYEDTGEFGTLEIDSEDETVDRPVSINGESVSAPFTVMLAEDEGADEEAEEEPADTEEDTEEVAE